MKTLAFSQHSRRGSALVLAVFIVTLLGVLIGLAFDYTANTARITRRAADYSTAQAVGNGALEAVYKQWQMYMSANQSKTIPADPAIVNYTNAKYFTGFTATALSNINTAVSGTGFSISQLQLDPVDRADNVVAQQSANTTSVGPLNNVPGWVANTTTYRVTVSVTKTSDPTFKVTMSRYFQEADASLFQAMLFFQDDLELHPGPKMTLYGLVHTNSNLYAAAGSGGSLTFNSNVSYTGNVSTLSPATNPAPSFNNGIGYVEGITKTLSTTESSSWGSFNPPVYANRDTQLSNVKSLSPLGTDVTKAIDLTNPDATSTHEIIERPAPTSATDPTPMAGYTDPDAFAAHRIYDTAQLRVFINHTKAYTTTTPDGTTVNSKVHVYKPDSTDPSKSVEIAPSTTKASPNIVDQITTAIAVSSGGDIKDQRENRNINLSTVDMAQLTPALNTYATTNQDYNGVLYITDVTNTPMSISNTQTYGNIGDSDAIRLKNGGTLPDIGLTVATDGAIYIQGDYNTGTTYTTVGGVTTPVALPVSDTAGDPTQFTMPGKTQKPAAVMGDAVMVLSNNWKDVNSAADISLRVATPTTLNTAIVSGMVLTNATSASGGAHNFPRFLENWSNQNFTYHGSMVELYASQHFTGKYGTGNVYSPPPRLWYFDNNFINSPPPGNLRTTNFTRGRWTRNVNS